VRWFLALGLWCGFVGASGLAVASEPPVEAGTPEERAQALYQEGSTLYSASDYEGAIEKFTAALHEASTTEMTPEVRGALLWNLARAHASAHAFKPDETHLRTAVDIYGRYLAEAEKLGYPAADVAEAREKLATLQEQLAQFEPEPANPAAETAGQEDQPEPTPVGPAKPSPAAKDGSGTSSSGPTVLITLGAIGVAAGAAGIGIGGSFERQARKQVDKYDDPFEREEAFVAEEKAKGRMWMGGGAVLAVAGLAMLITGLVLHRRKRRATALTSTPMFGNGLAGLSLRGSLP
jgi:hypothetical protein